MLTYLEKFNNLPKEVRDRVKSAEVTSIIDGLENKYGVKLAATIMKIAVKEIPETGMDVYLSKALSLDSGRAKELAGEIEEKIMDKVFPKEIVPVGETHLIKYEKDETATQLQSVNNFQSPPPPFVKGAESGQMQAEKPIASPFFFSPDDEKEIMELVKKIDVPETPKPVADVKEKVVKAFDELQINFGSEFLADRFRKIIETYLKGIRNRLETKATLQKPFEQGGLSFDEESVAKILEALDKYKASDEEVKIAPPRRIVLPEDKMSVPDLKRSAIRDVDYDFGALIAKKADASKSENKEEVKTVTVKKEGTVKPPEVAKAGEIEPAVVPVPEKKEEPKPDASIPPIRFSEAPGKVKMHDIRAPKPKIMTPIDELKYLDLVNFRRLARESLLKAKEKIREKVKLLGEESYDKRIEGIKAWRTSPINKLYLQIGEESISKNEPIDVIIEERKARGDEYLTNAEIDVIMDLNKELRF
jgi:hypothetical protein